MSNLAGMTPAQALAFANPNASHAAFIHLDELTKRWTLIDVGNELDRAERLAAHARMCFRRGDIERGDSYMRQAYAVNLRAVTMRASLLQKVAS